MSRRRRVAFTVTGLLVAMGLGWVALENFEEAQVRSLANAWVLDLRTIARALDDYRVDHGAYPPVRDLHRITTPVAYLSSLPNDPLADTRGFPHRYHTDGTRFIVGSFGPDRDEATGGDLPWSDAEAMNALLADQTRLLPYTYDPSNGAFSEGDFWRIGTAPDEPKASETKP